MIVNFFYLLAALFLGTGCWSSIRYYKTLDENAALNSFKWLLAGFSAQVLAVGSQWWQLGWVPLDRLDGILAVLALSLGFTLIVGRSKASVPILGSLFLPLIFFLALAAFLLNLNSRSFMDQHLLTTAMSLHIFLTFLGFSNFTVGFGVGVVFWIQEGQLKQHQMKGWGYRLPSLEILDSVTVFHIALGFVLWAAGLVLGTQQAFLVWNSVPFLDPKILGSVLVLIIYALFFLLRWVFSMRGKKTMALVMVGYFLALFTFFGVRLFLTTQHSF